VVACVLRACRSPAEGTVAHGMARTVHAVALPLRILW
jgi:hypothetical protein